VTVPNLRETDLAFYGSESEKLAAQLRSITGIQELDQLDDAPETLSQLRALAHGGGRNFPEPRHAWSLSKFDGASEWDCLRFLAPVAGKRVAQVGGSGAWAVAFGLAGAREAWLISPFQPELEAGLEIARLMGVHLHCQLCPAEQLAFADGYFDAIFAPASAHHFDTEKAFPEIWRVLRDDGKFAAFDPWLTPIYKQGVRLFGKRERGVHCVPLDPQRLIPLYRWFPGAEVRHHGAFTRYLLILLGRFITLPDSLVWSTLSVDDVIAKALGLRGLGSGVALLAQRTGEDRESAARQIVDR
jgi:SAM-dependent methyltransferase